MGASSRECGLQRAEVLREEAHLEWRSLFNLRRSVLWRLLEYSCGAWWFPRRKNMASARVGWPAGIAVLLVILSMRASRAGTFEFSSQEWERCTCFLSCPPSLGRANHQCDGLKPGHVPLLALCNRRFLRIIPLYWLAIGVQFYLSSMDVMSRFRTDVWAHVMLVRGKGVLVHPRRVQVLRISPFLMASFRTRDRLRWMTALLVLMGVVAVLNVGFQLPQVSTVRFLPFWSVPGLPFNRIWALDSARPMGLAGGGCRVNLLIWIASSGPVAGRGRHLPTVGDRRVLHAHGGTRGRFRSGKAPLLPIG